MENFDWYIPKRGGERERERLLANEKEKLDQVIVIQLLLLL